MMPEKLRTVEQGLRMVGYGPQVDEFVLSMNRAAEQSAPAAKQIFLDAIASMSFDDAKAILSGGNTACHRVLQGKDDGQTCGGLQAHRGPKHGRGRRDAPVSGADGTVQCHPPGEGADV